MCLRGICFLSCRSWEVFQIRKKLQQLFTDKLTSCNLRIIYMSPTSVKSIFTLKDRLPKMLLSGLVSKYQCDSCIVTYYGQAKFVEEFVNTKAFLISPGKR